MSVVRVYHEVYPFPNLQQGSVRQRRQREDESSLRDHATITTGT